MEAVSEWSSIFPALLLQIASKLTVLEDFMALRGVCRPWRACITRDKFTCVSKFPLLMLAEKGDNDHDNVREFYSLCKGRICMRMPFPEGRGKRCLDAGFGWILTAPKRYFHGGYSLVKLRPMDSSIALKIQLPNNTAFPGYTADDYVEHYIQRAVLSANPSETSDFALMICSNTFLGFWRNGGSYWIGSNMGFESICYHKTKFYALDFQGYIWAWDDFYGLQHVFTINTHYFRPYTRSYLVESSKGELLLIIRGKIFDSTTGPRGASSFRVVHIDLSTNCKCYPLINGLDGDAIFIGLNSAVTVADHDFPDLIKPNSIYFTDDFTEVHMPCVKAGMDMGIFNVEDYSIETFDVKSFSFACPPVWIFPS